MTTEQRIELARRVGLPASATEEEILARTLRIVDEGAAQHFSAPGSDEPPPARDLADAGFDFAPLLQLVAPFNIDAEQLVGMAWIMRKRPDIAAEFGSLMSAIDGLHRRQKEESAHAAARR